MNIDRILINRMGNLKSKHSSPIFILSTLEPRGSSPNHSTSWALLTRNAAFFNMAFFNRSFRLGFSIESTSYRIWLNQRDSPSTATFRGRGSPYRLFNLTNMNSSLLDSNIVEELFLLPQHCEE